MQIWGSWLGLELHNSGKKLHYSHILKYLETKDPKKSGTKKSLTQRKAFGKKCLILYKLS